MKPLMLILLLAHFLGDFYFQFQMLSDKKDRHFRYLLLHGVQYAAVMIAAVYLVFGEALLGYAAVAAALYLLIDAVKFFISRKISAAKEGAVYLADQALHLATLAAVAASAYLGMGAPALTGWLNYLFYHFGLNADTVFAWLTALTAAVRPANITVKKLIGTYKPKQKPSESVPHVVTESDTESNKAGALIGTLERLLMLILISMMQYSAIGLVLTAKSIARYKKIEEDSAFGEYYLLGTLMSTLLVIVIHIFIF